MAANIPVNQANTGTSRVNGDASLLGPLPVLPTYLPTPPASTSFLVEGSFFSADSPPNTLPWPDIGHLGKWSVSSYKFGFGVECLRDNDNETFWHSDGPQPHFMTVQFPRKIAIQKISLHLSIAMDDSYTPSTICVRAGTGLNDLQDVRFVTLDKPNGWITFDVSTEYGEEGDGFKPIYAYVIQVVIISNHMNGKDTHVRGLHILGPIENSTSTEDPFPFVSPNFKMFEGVR